MRLLPLRAVWLRHWDCLNKSNMELKDFVRDTLLDIVQGVKEAQALCGTEGAIISPRDAGQLGHKVKIKDKMHYV